ncbi:MAG: M20/M25/M40 family metallo-hydrolase [Solirubrobacteraceae bacterium]|nr:MAG: peptidase dimerization protein [Solirubrobacterales bacterium]
MDLIAGRGATIAELARAIAGRAERELEALVAVSSPSGDVDGAEAAASVLVALLADESKIEVERVPCSSRDHAPDLIARVRGSGNGRIALLGHLDTVVAHDGHRPLHRRGDRLVGSGSVDMKGGVVLAVAVLRMLARRPEAFAEAALLCVMDEEWRTEPFAHTERLRNFDACLCFEAGQLVGASEAVVVQRKAAGTLLVEAHGRAAHSGSAPDRGHNALLALAEAARLVAAHHDPAGPDRLTAVPTILRCGDAFNVVPAAGELFCDLRADRLAAFDDVLAAIPQEVGGARLSATMQRLWPGMDSGAATARVLEGATARLGSPIVASERGGASDASHLASTIPVTVDGLGPRGGRAHAPDEYVLVDSLVPRAAIALALVAEVLGVDWSAA